MMDAILAGSGALLIVFYLQTRINARQIRRARMNTPKGPMRVLLLDPPKRRF